MTKQEFGAKLKSLKTLIKKRKLQGLLIYGSVENDAIMRWLIGTASIEFNYLLLTETNFYVFESGYFLESLKARLPNDKKITIICSKNLSKMIKSVTLAASRMRSIGYAGPAQYRDLIKIKANLIDVNEDISKIMIIKSGREIKAISNACKKYREIIGRTYLNQGMTEKDIAKNIQSNAILYGCDILPTNITVVAGERLKRTTDAFPSEYWIKEGDVVCIDCVLRLGNYFCDITRCFFVGFSEYEATYKKLEAVQNEAIRQLKPDISSKDITNIYAKLFKKQELEKYFVKTNLGHGIGCALHEKPNLGDGDIKLQNGMVFTLEPELNLGNIRLRIEDVVSIINDKAIKLS